jgi:hypothetical protein
MIRYRLHCEHGHEFEGWFASSSAYDVQAERGLLSCSLCGSSNIDKAMMAPNVQTARGRAKSLAKSMAHSLSETPQAVSPAAETAAVAAGAPPAMLDLMRQVREHIRQHSDDVGDKFAEEARRIHYDEVEARAIHGQASRDEVVALLDEGIEILPVPILPEDRN